MWYVAVAVVIGIVKVSKSVIVRRSLDPNIVNPQFLVCLEIVINDHSTGADDRHFAYLARLQPAALDGREALVTKRERNVRHVLHVRGNVSIPLTIHRQR